MDYRYRRCYRGPIKLVILDWAGTTLDFGCMAPAVVFVDVYRARGVEITMAQAREPMGLHKRDHIAAIGELPDVARAWVAAHGAPQSDADVDAMFADFKPRQLACLADYAELIDGVVDTVAALRARGIRIGGTTGYFTEAHELLQREAAARGYEPDVSVCASEVPVGRPEPWMVFGNMQRAGVFPPSAVVKVDDTRPGVQEGLEAGVWTVGLAASGNEVGMPKDELDALPEAQRARLIAGARERLAREGAHYVIDSVAELVAVIDDVEARLARGDKP